MPGLPVSGPPDLKVGPTGAPNPGMRVLVRRQNKPRFDRVLPDVLDVARPIFVESQKSFEIPGAPHLDVADTLHVISG